MLLTKLRNIKFNPTGICDEAAGLVADRRGYVEAAQMYRGCIHVSAFNGRINATGEGPYMYAISHSGSNTA